MVSPRQESGFGSHDWLSVGYLAWDCVNFQHTSNDIKLTEGGTKLEAVLRKQDGNYSQPQGIYLNERIVNRDGHLKFGKSSYWSLLLNKGLAVSAPVVSMLTNFE